MCDGRVWRVKLSGKHKIGESSRLARSPDTAR